MTYNLFIDDERFPPEGKKWKIVRSSQEAIDYCKQFGLPSFISFDHDLGGDDTSIKFVQWMIDKCLDNPALFFPTDYTIHSQNPVGAKNIKSLMQSFINFKYKE